MKQSKLIPLVSLLILLFLRVSAQSNGEGFLIHLSSDDPHRVGMALSFADKMSDDYNVLVFVDIKGVNVMLKDSDSISFKNFESSKILIDQLLEKGVKIAICPMCLEASGHTKYDLINGLELAGKEDFFNFNEGRIITLDY